MNRERVGIAKARSTLPLQHLVLLEFNSRTAEETVDWLLGKLSEAESRGGAELLGRVIDQPEGGGRVVVIGATSERLLFEVDEELLFRRKPFRCGHGLHPNNTHPTHPGEAEGLHGILSSAEAVNLVRRILGQLTVGEREKVPGVSVLPGNSIINILHRHGFITDSYPLHDASQLTHLRQAWRVNWGGLKPFNRMYLLEEIKEYFGEGVAHYFCFLGSLITALLQKSLLLLVLNNLPFCHSWSGWKFFTFSSMVWSELFLNGWKQRCEDLKADWEGPKSWQSNRCSSGSTGLREAVENTTVNKYSRFRLSMLFLISMLLLSSILILAYLCLDTIVWIFSHKQQMSTIIQTLDYLPEIALTVAMEGMDHIALQFSHRLCAKYLYQGTNARLYQPLLPELIIVYIYNHFAIHFYRALVQPDLITLQHQLTVQFVTQIALQLLTGCLLPFLHWKRTGTQLERQPLLLQQIQNQSSRPSRKPFETHGHLSILLAYCHVMLFSGIYPQCALWCLLKAVAQSNLDFWHMCVFYRRPFLQPASGIRHTWSCIFDIVGVLSTVANCVLLWTSSDVQLFSLGLSQWEVLEVILVPPLLMMGVKMAVTSVTSRILNSSAPQPERPRQHPLRQCRLHCQ